MAINFQSFLSGKCIHIWRHIVIVLVIEQKVVEGAQFVRLVNILRHPRLPKYLLLFLHFNLIREVRQVVFMQAI